MKKVWNWIARDLWILLLDIVAVNLAYYLAILVRFYMAGSIADQIKEYAQKYYLPTFLNFAPFYTVLCIAVFALFKLYGGMWRYAGINDMNRIIGASLVTTLIQVVGTSFIMPPSTKGRMPIPYYLIGAVLQFGFISLIRFGYRILLVEKRKLAARNSPYVPAMIIGAGETARKAIAHLEDTPFRAVVAADGKSAGQMLNGVPVVADYAASLGQVRAVFIADRKLDAEKRAEIEAKCAEAGIEVQDYTGMLSNLGGRVPVASLMSLISGPVTLVTDGQEQAFGSGEEALAALKERYEIEGIEGAKVTLRKSSAAAYVGYDAWAQQHKEDTGEDVSFF